MTELRTIDLQLFADDDGETGSVADSQTDTDDTSTDTGDETGTDKTGEAGDVDQQRTSKQPPEVDAAFAKIRREAEEAKRKLGEQDKWVSDNYGKSHGIHSWDQYQQALAQQRQQAETTRQQQRETELAEQGYDVNAIREIMRTDPEFRKVQQENMALKQELQAERTQKEFDTDFSDLKSAYPEFKGKTLDEFCDSMSEDAFKVFSDKVKRGYSLTDAYTLINHNNLLQKTKEAAKQKTLNDMNSKAHLKTEGDGASDATDVHVPPETMQMYRDMGMTVKQASAYHKKLYG